MANYGSGIGKSNTIVYNDLLSQTLFNYKDKMADNISKRNILWTKAKEKGLYEAASGGVAIEEKLLYEINDLQWFSGHDVLNRTPIDGVTVAQFDWCEAATPIMISRKEEKQNKGKSKIVSMLSTKMTQAEKGIKEGWIRDFLQGKGGKVSGASVKTNAVNTGNGAIGMDPIAKLIDYTPTVSAQIGGLDQATYAWWQNKSKDFGGAAVTADVFLDKFDELYQNCSDNSEGDPDLIWCDPVTWRLFRQAYFKKYQTQAPSNTNYPFQNFMFNNAVVVWDSRIPNASDDSTDTSVATGKGTAYMINTDYIKIRYEEDSDFSSTEFVRPIDQMSRIAYIIWMGAVTINNRRCHGVMGNIARSLS